MMISISGAGLYTVFETLKSFNSNSHINVAKDAGILFILAIVLNVISQWTGNHANELDTDHTEELISEEKEHDKPAKLVKIHAELERLKAQIDQYNAVTFWLNFASTATVFSGIVLLAAFYYSF